MRKYVCAMMAVFLTASFVSNALAGITYAIDVRAVDNRLITFPANAPALNVVAQSPGVYNGFAMDFDNTGSVLYGITFNGAAGSPQNFGTIDQATGLHTIIAPMSSASAETNWADLMIAPDNSVYALAISGGPPAAVNRIYSVNPATGAATLLSTLNLVAGTVIDIGIDVSGNFYGNDFTRDMLVQINPITGATTDIGPTGVNASFAQGMDFDWSTNTLYGTVYTGGGTGMYASFNLATGAATSLLSTTAWNAEMEMAINSPIPEPASLSFLALAGLGLFGRRRK